MYRPVSYARLLHICKLKCRDGKGDDKVEVHKKAMYYILQESDHIKDMLCIEELEEA